MTAPELALILLAGFAAGAVNSMAGGGTLIFFPVLVATGMTARLATITSAVGLLPGYAGGTVAYRRELRGQGRRVLALMIFVLLGAAAGAGTLLMTSDAAFGVVVPFLILGSCVLLALQPRIAAAVVRHRAVRSSTLSTVGERAGIAAGSIYGAYFGAGMGALLLAVLGIFIDEDLQRLNALKGLISLLVSLVGTAVFVAFGAVSWSAAVALGAGAWCGGTVGVRIARRLPAVVLRRAVVTFGAVVAVVFFLRS